MRRRSSLALPNFGTRRTSNASNASAVKDEIVKDIFHVGLVNLGNSCFYNTIVQSLSATQPLADIIAEAPESSPALRALSPASPEYNPDLDALPAPIPMAAALLVLLDKLDPTTTNDGNGAKNKKAFNPKGLLRQLSLKYDEYAEATQQDSHECLRHLIDGVMMEEQDLIKKIVEMTPDHRPSMHSRHATARPSQSAEADAAHAEAAQSVLTPTAGGTTLASALAAEASGSESDASSSAGDVSSSSSSPSSSDDEMSEWETNERKLTPRQKKKRSLRPFVGSIFEGKLASFIICDECKNVSLTKEDFMDLSLSLRDDAGNRMRKRDRIRRTLQAGFFGRKSGKASSGEESGPKQGLNGLRREHISLSEAEAMSSTSEADETDEDHIRPANLRAHADANGSHATSVRSRIHSLDPSSLSREDARPRRSLLAPSEQDGQKRERDASPLGRAFSMRSRSSQGDGHEQRGPGRKAQIPRPTAEQVAYIKKVLVDIPGPNSSNAPPPGLRVSHPPGSRPASSGADAGAVSDGASSAASSLSQLNLSAPAPPPAVSWQDTDLFECFRQFTSVEVLEGENSFACHNCWRWLNPELEAKRRADKAQRRVERVERHRTRRAERRRQNGQAAVTPNASDHGREGTTDDDERDPADRTARNTPSHSPRLGSAFTPLAPVPPIESIDGEPGVLPGEKVVAEPQQLSTAASPAPSGTPGTPMRHFSVSSVATTTSEPRSVSTDYEGGISSEAFETTTDDGEGDGFEEDDESPGLDDAGSLNQGGLSALPLKNADAAAAIDEREGKPVGRTMSEAVSESLQGQVKPLPPPSHHGHKAFARHANGHGAAAAATGNGSGTPSSGNGGAKTDVAVPPKKQRHILRRAHKRYLFSPADLPPVLVVHLKRFMQTSKSSLFGSAFVNLKKRDDPVSFPKEMDLTPFLAPPGRPPHLNPNAFGSGSSAATSTTDGDLDGVELEKEVHNARYRLYAAVVHFGDLNTGHYASYVLSNRYGRGEQAGRGERRWVFCSDEDVTAVSEAEVLRSKAYMLFYERVEDKTGAVAASEAPSNTTDVDVAPVGTSVRSPPSVSSSLSATPLAAPTGSNSATEGTASRDGSGTGTQQPAGQVPEPGSVEERVPETVPE